MWKQLLTATLVFAGVANAAFPADIVDFHAPTEDVSIEIAASDYEGKTAASWTAVNSTFRSLRVSLRGAQTLDGDKPFLSIVLANISCPEGSNGLLSCVTFAVKSAEGAESTKSYVTNTEITATRVTAASVFSFVVEDNVVLSQSTMTISDVRGCTRDATSCVSVNAARGSAIDNVRLFVAHSTLDKYADSASNVSSTFLAVNLEGRAIDSSIAVQSVRYKYASSTAGPVRIVGAFSGETNNFTLSLSNLANVGYSLSGAIVNSAIIVDDCYSTIRNDRATMSVALSASTYSLDKPAYAYYDVHPSGDDGLLSIADGSTVRFRSAYLIMQNGNNPEPRGLRVSNVAVTGGSKFITELWGDREVKSTFSLWWHGKVESGSQIAILNNALLDVAISTEMSDATCTKDSSCGLLIEHNTFLTLNVTDSILPLGALLLIYENKRFGDANVFLRNISGAGAISSVNNYHLTSAIFAGDFVGTLEVFGSGTYDKKALAGLRDSFEFVREPLPKRILLGWNDIPINFGGPMLSTADGSAAVVATLDFGCTRLFNASSPQPSTNLTATPTVACVEGNVVTRCGEGLSVYNRGTLADGHRDEYVTREGVEPCTIEQFSPYRPSTATATTAATSVPSTSEVTDTTTTTDTPTSIPTTTGAEQKDDEGLSKTTILAIAGGAAGGFIVVIGAVVFLVVRKRRAASDGNYESIADHINDVSGRA